MTLLPANQSTGPRFQAIDADVIPDDILMDPSLERRTFFDGLSFRAAITLGRLCRFHTLLIPGSLAGYSESIGDFASSSTVLAHLGQMIRLVNRAVNEKLSSGAHQVLFEHGNSGFRSASRYGTHVAHMHSIWTSKPEEFQHELETQIARDSAWIRIPGWEVLPEIAALGIEYLFIQVSEDKAWCRKIATGSEVPRQYLRKLVHASFGSTGEQMCTDWLWRSNSDQQDAENEADELRPLLKELAAAASSAKSSRVVAA